MSRGALLLLLLAGGLLAEEHDSLNFGIDWPSGEGWGAVEDRPGPEGVFGRGVSGDERGRDFLVMVIPARDANLEGDGYARGLVKGMSKGLPGARVTSERRHEVAGIPAITLHIEAEREDTPVRIVHRAVIADDRIYALNATAREGDEDWVEAAFAGFRFLRKPTPPKDAAFRLGEKVGGVLFWLLIAASGPLGVWLGRRHRRRRAGQAKGAAEQESA